MSERDQVCDWCIGRPEPDNGEIGCLLCGDTRMIGYSIGDLPQKREEKKTNKAFTTRYALECAVKAITKGTVK